MNKSQKFGGIVHIQLLEDVFAVSLNGVFTQKQPLRNMLRIKSLGYEPNHIHLPFRYLMFQKKNVVFAGLLVNFCFLRTY